KAISAIGTGAIGIHDPKALLNARIWQRKNYAFDPEDPRPGIQSHIKHDGSPWPITFFGDEPISFLDDERTRPRRFKLKPRRHRPQACVACHAACRGRYEDGLANEIICENSAFYGAADSPDVKRKACKILNDLGLNAFELKHSVRYLEALHKSGAFAPGTGLDCPLDFEKYGTLEFAEQFMRMIAYGDDGRGNPSRFGEDMAEGIMRAAQKWGKLDGFSGETKDVLMSLFPFWGLPMHRDPRTDLIWGYGSVLADRDINEHCFDTMHRSTPEGMVGIVSAKMPPFQDDPLMFDFSDEGMYSEHMAKLISWHRYYTRYYKQSLLFCDTRWPDFVNYRVEGGVGLTGEAEPKFLKAVTGKNLSFPEGIELGRKIWNLDNVIWSLQGRHRDMVHFTDIHYERPGPEGHAFPCMKDGKWERVRIKGRQFDKDRFDDFKTEFYKVQGWDTASGFPTRSTLAGMGLDYVADELEAQGKLGA
ncbi:MAG: aldehyde ferredoxin oxidoreductase C-terminal domain-containing protein, partial [Planctomycetota bacterium]|nr:aldehyde ferredoxin oxidoreductase C-terminal domain-containing protein [Planctomycetota bacterium]